MRDDGHCLPASALFCLRHLYPSEWNFDNVLKIQCVIRARIRENRAHWEPLYNSVRPVKDNSITFDQCLSFRDTHPEGLWNSRMGHFMPMILAHILQREIVVHDIDGVNALFSNFLPFPSRLTTTRIRPIQKPSL